MFDFDNESVLPGLFSFWISMPTISYLPTTGNVRVNTKSTADAVMHILLCACARVDVHM